MTDRHPPDRPWVWQGEAELSIIQALDAHVPTAIAVYVALTRCANQARADTFTVPQPQVAEMAGVDVKTLRTYVKLLETHGLITRLPSNGKRVATTWRLIQSGRDARTNRNQSGRSAPTESGRSARSLTNIEKELQEGKRISTSSPAAAVREVHPDPKPPPKVKARGKSYKNHPAPQTQRHQTHTAGRSFKEQLESL